MDDELKIDGRELLELAEEAPREVETIIEMLIEAEEDPFPEDEQN